MDVNQRIDRLMLGKKLQASLWSATTIQSRRARTAYLFLQVHVPGAVVMIQVVEDSRHRVTEDEDVLMLCCCPERKSTPRRLPALQQYPSDCAREKAMAVCCTRTGPTGAYHHQGTAAFNAGDSEVLGEGDREDCGQ